MLEKGIVYVARLMERLELRPNLSGAANPKSSTGRIDIFTRLIVDGGEAFDDVPLDYKGELWLEISPRSFSVRVKAGIEAEPGSVPQPPPPAAGSAHFHSGR